jgi:hypothetical protein
VGESRVRVGGDSGKPEIRLYKKAKSTKRMAGHAFRTVLPRRFFREMAGADQSPEQRGRVLSWLDFGMNAWATARPDRRTLLAQRSSWRRPAVSLNPLRTATCVRLAGDAHTGAAMRAT